MGRVPGIPCTCQAFSTIPNFLYQRFLEFLNLEAINNEDTEYPEEEEDANDVISMSARPSLIAIGTNKLPLAFLDNLPDVSDTLIVSPLPLVDDNDSEAEIEGYIAELNERSHKWRQLENGSLGSNLHVKRSPSGSEDMPIWRVQCKYVSYFTDNSSYLMHVCLVRKSRSFGDHPPRCLEQLRRRQLGGGHCVYSASSL